jgi:hypothetical protein
VKGGELLTSISASITAVDGVTIAILLDVLFSCVLGRADGKCARIISGASGVGSVDADGTDGTDGTDGEAEGATLGMDTFAVTVAFPVKLPAPVSTTVSTVGFGEVASEVVGHGLPGAAPEVWTNPGPSSSMLDEPSSSAVRRTLFYLKYLRSRHSV